MSDGRKRLSGSQYRKSAKVKKEKEDEVIRKSRKVESYFHKVDSDVSEPNELSTVNQLFSLKATENSGGSSGGGEVADKGNNSSNLIAGSDNCYSKSEQDLCEILVCESYETDPGKCEVSLELVSSDPAKWICNEETRDYIATHGISFQNSGADFSKSKRMYADGPRYCSKNIFERKLRNGETVKRQYLVYSESEDCVFCVPCRLFGGTTVFGQTGFSDWRHATERLNEHESSQAHRNCIMTLKERGKKLGKIDEKLTKQLDDEIEYWRNVLKRVVAVVKALATRGLAFRGTDERIGSPNNGNFMMSLELIAQFDPFLAEHLKKHGNPGKGNTSYISFATYEQFIQIMGEEVVSTIVAECQAAKYFSISVDSTPDVSHTDQLTFIVRYVKQNGEPVERFLCFIPNAGHKSSELADTVFTILSKYKLDITNLRGQSYDNARNMSGKYTGLQARILEKNNLAVYSPCSAHSLNLIGTCAAECCIEACNFFDMLQKLYNFFTSSTYRWKLLQESQDIVQDKSDMAATSKVTVKGLSGTRWSAREDACRSLNRNWSMIIRALEKIEADDNEKLTTRLEARGLLKKLSRLETAISARVWDAILGRFNAVSKVLQRVDIDISDVVQQYDALAVFVAECKTSFEVYEEEAKAKSGLQDYDVSKRKIKKKTFFDDDDDDSQNKESFQTSSKTPRETFVDHTYLTILSKLEYELKRRSEAYRIINDKFGFLSHLRNTPASEVASEAKKLKEIYKDDLEEEFVNECLHLRGYLIKREQVEMSPLRLSKILHEDDLQGVFPNVDIALRIFFCTPASNCSGERSFSVLKRVKNYLRSSMLQERLNALAILNIESEMVQALDFDRLVTSFAEKRSRRRRIM